MSRARLKQYVHCAVAHGFETPREIVQEVIDWVTLGDAAQRKALGLSPVGEKYPATTLGRAKAGREISKAVAECTAQGLIHRNDEMIEDEPMDEGKYGLRVKFSPALRLWCAGPRGPQVAEYVLRWRRYVNADGEVVPWEALVTTEAKAVKRREQR